MTEYQSTPEATKNLEQALRDSIIQVVSPPSDMTVGEWANEHRWVKHGTAFPGKWDTDFTPYMRECMEVVSDPFVRKVVLMFSSQVGKTELLLNTIGYHIHTNPSYIMCVYPTGGAAKKFAKERVGGMLIDNPAVNQLIEADSQIQYKQFPGGSLDVVTARSPSELAAKSIKIMLLDEVDRYEPSSGNEGDPVELATRRVAAYWDSKLVMVSSPGDKSKSRIEPAYLGGDQRRYHVPCLQCGEFQVLLWKNLICEKDEDEHRISSTAHFQCIFCSERMEATDKRKMIREGKWIPTSNGEYPSFHLSAFYSPMPQASWANIVKIHQEAHSMRDMEKLKSWTNTLLGETWEDKGESVEPDTLLDRIELYDDEVPEGVKVLVAAADTQKDRIEIAIWGIGYGYESWLIHTEKIIMDPLTGNFAWDALKDIAERVFMGAGGKKFRARCLAIDHGYSLTRTRVEHFVNSYKGPLKVIAVKGTPGEADYYLQRPSASKHGEFKPYLVKTWPVKDRIYNAFTIGEPGPGFIHLPDWYNINEIVQQLTAEEKRTTRKMGIEKKVWHKTRRNEQLDMFVYCIASLNLFGSGFVQKITGASDAELPEASIESEPKTPKKEDKQPESMLQTHLRQRLGKTRRQKGKFVGWNM